MHYSEGAEWKPLFESSALVLQVATGCSHNRCHFCDMYHKPFAISPIGEVLEDIRELASSSKAGADRLFLAGGNAFSLPADYLQLILQNVAQELPNIKSIGCFARISDIAAKTDEDLRLLAALNLNLVSIGAESGLDTALANMEKGFDAFSVIGQCARLDDVGIEYALFYLAGICGKGGGEENARVTAEVFGRTNPRIIMIHTMSIFEGTRLAARIDNGEFEPASEKEIQRELREFYRLFPKKTTILATHISNTVAFSAELPEEREAILHLMDERIGLDDESELALRRKRMTSI